MTLHKVTQVNPLPHSDAVREQKKYFRGSLHFSILTMRKISRPRNLKFNNLGIFQSLKLRILMGKILKDFERN